MKAAPPVVRQRRAEGAAIVLAIVMGILVLAFFRAQVLQGGAWSLRAESNRLLVQAIPAPRGTIFDRYGDVVAENLPSYSISLPPAPADSVRGMLERIGPILGLSEARLEELQSQANQRAPLTVLLNATYEQVSLIEELRGAFPWVLVEMVPRRRYIGGAAIGHIVGYAGEISSQELTMPRFAGYEPRMIVGKEGLERQYEASLQGVQGVRYVEVDARRRIVGSFQGQRAIEAVPGTDLHLNIDLGTMQFIHEIFPDSLRGAVVILNVEDGGILALYSAPSFDPNDFVGGIDRGLWNDLNVDPSLPLFNRATMGKYPPASTWKVATAAIGLELGVVTPQEMMPSSCTGSFRFQNVVRNCWNAAGHGHLDLSGALANSCNVYFYQLGLRIGLSRLVEQGSRLGFDEPCGVDLPTETSGDFPESLDWWQRRFGYRPAENEVMPISIGQGPNAQSPLKMAQFYLALGRGGSAPAPRLARLGPGEAPEIAWTLNLSEENLAAILDGLRAVTAPGGTAHMSSLEHWDLIGKTGTAQQGIAGSATHAWFTGLAGRWEASPEVAVAVIVEEAGGGSSVAAPIAAKAVDFYLRTKYGIPISEVQTLREHQNAGVPAPWARW